MAELEKKLLAQIKGLISAVESNSGAEPSVSVLYREVDLAKILLAEAEAASQDIGYPVLMKVLVTRPHGTYWTARRIADGTDVVFAGDTPMDAVCKTFGEVPTPNFCARCGKRLTPDGAHTCKPPMSCDAELEKEIRREAAEAERRACANVCASHAGIWQKETVADTALRLAAAIRARGQK